MRRLVLSAEARQNLRSVHDYIHRESGNRETARRFIKKIREKCEHLTVLPFPVGALRPEIGPQIRSYAFGNYVLFCRHTPEVMEVALIIEGHRDIETLAEDL